VTGIRVARLLAACGVAAMSCAAAAAQQPDAKNLLKGRVKPGMYETKAYNDLSGMPGIPKDQQKTTETHTRCVTAAEVDKGVELRSDCKVKDFRQTASSFEIVSRCPDGSLQELRIAATPTGFSSVVKSESKEKGKAHNMTMRTESRYLGACKG
jgi:hypothetical protein